MGDNNYDGVIWKIILSSTVLTIALMFAAIPFMYYFNMWIRYWVS